MSTLNPRTAGPSVRCQECGHRQPLIRGVVCESCGEPVTPVVRKRPTGRCVAVADDRFFRNERVESGNNRLNPETTDQIGESRRADPGEGESVRLARVCEPAVDSDA